MSKYFLITKVQLKEIFDFRTMFNRRNRAKSASFIGILGLFIVLFGFISTVYNLSFAAMLNATGDIDYLPALMFTASSIVILFTTIFKVKGTVFGSKDFDTLGSLPIKPSVIVASKITVLYIYELFFAILIMLPCLVVYLIFNPSNFVMIIPSFVAMLFIPVIPITLASFLGIGISLLSEKFRFKTILQIVLYSALVGGIMFLSMGSSNVDLSNGIVSLIKSMEKVYPLTRFFLNGCVMLKPLDILLFFGINVVVLGLFCFLIGKIYNYVNLLVLSTRAHKKYVEKKLKTNGQIKAIFLKEIRKLFKTPIYLLNTLMSGLLLIFMAVFLCIQFNGLDQETLDVMLPLIMPFIPVIICFIIGMTSTTCVSISLEGNNFWIIKSSPIDYKKYFLSKILVSFILLGSCSIIASVILIVFFKIWNIDALFIILIPLCYTLLSAYIGLILNLMYPKMKWITEQAAVKNSASMLLAMLVDFIFTVVIAIVYYLFYRIDLVLVANIIAGVLIAGGIVASHLLLKNNGNRWINKIEV